MDPARAAMIAGRSAPDRGNDRRDRRDDRRRDRPPRGPKPAHASGGRHDHDHPRNPAAAATYMTEDELSRRFVDGEETFVLRQSKKKADIRVRERRAKPIDLLAFHLRWVDVDRDAFDDEPGDARIVVPAPDAVLASVTSATGRGGAGAGADADVYDKTGQDDGWRLDELEKDIQSFLALDKNRQNRAYWKALLVLCRDARAQQQADHGGGESGRVLGAVAADIDRILQPKTLAELEALERQIESKLRRAREADPNDEPIDTDYWEQLLRRLRVWKAKAALATIGAASEAARLAALEQAGGEVGEGDEEEADSSKKRKAREDEAGNKNKNKNKNKKQKADNDDDDDDDNAPPPGTERFALAAANNEDVSQATQALYDREVARGVGENEEVFAAEEEVLTTASAVAGRPQPAWADKYRPRKPRYFNRVQMGYEWNKYNQTHYDHDNPPPKVVQGYKFNIFYPELLDKSKAPTYHITREGGRRKGESFAPAGEEDTCLIRFAAGPPYEDVAFRIVDREWDYSARHQRGFKSVFEKGILQLHFQFKKVYYRK